MAACAIKLHMYEKFRIIFASQDTFDETSPGRAVHVPQVERSAPCTLLDVFGLNVKVDSNLKSKIT